MRTTKKTINVAIVTTLTVLLSGCGGGRMVFMNEKASNPSTTSQKSKKKSPEQIAENPTEPPVDAGPLALSPNAGVKNFRSIFASMGSVTGVSQAPGTRAATGVSPNAVVATYEKFQTQLSPTGEASAVSSSLALATGVLAGEHCRAMIVSIKANAAAKATSMFKNVNFTLSETQFTPQLTSTVVDDVAQSVWQRLPRADEKAALTKAVQDSVAGVAAPNVVTNTDNVALVLCAGAMGSMQFFRN